MPVEEKAKPAASRQSVKPLYSARQSIGIHMIEPEPLIPNKRKSIKQVANPGPTVSESKTRIKHSVSIQKIEEPAKAEQEKICNQVITIPPELPDILKLYAKGAMRTQPPDLLRWSGAFFRAMANKEPLPMKEKVEFPLRESSDHLSPGILRLIDIQLGSKSGQKIETSLVLKRWRGFGLALEAYNAILEKAQMTGENVVEWDNLIATMASTIAQNLPDTMAILCEVLTEQPEGTEPMINYQLWISLYTFLGTKVYKTATPDKIKALDACLSPVAQNNGGTIGPKDVTSSACQL